MKADAVIQARVGSTRLAGKALLKVLNKTILEYVIERVKKAKNIERIIVATSMKPEDTKIVDLASRLKIEIYRGSEEDVLDRFYKAAKLYKMAHIVRITADCPLIDPDIIDNVIRLYFERGADYCSNILNRSFPDGEDVEIFNFNILQYTWENASLLSEREHVTPYMMKRHDKFKLINFERDGDLSNERWTLDTREDFEFIKKILESLYPKNPDFKMEDILEFLSYDKNS